MVYNKNLVFLSHKAGMDHILSNNTEEQYNEKMMAMIYVAAVSWVLREITNIELDYGRIYASLLHL